MKQVHHIEQRRLKLMDPTEPNGIMNYLGYTDNHTDTGELKLFIHLKCL